MAKPSTTDLLQATTAPNPHGLKALRARHFGLFVFAIAIISSTLTNMDQSLFSYVLPQIMGSFGFTLNDTGAIISLSFVAAGWSWMYSLFVGLGLLISGLFFYLARRGGPEVIHAPVGNLATPA